MLTARLLLLVASALGVSTTNCAGICTSTEETECSRADMDAVSASSAVSTAQVNGTTLSVVEVTENTNPVDGTCYSRLQPIHVEGSPGATNLELAESEVWTSCSLGGREFFLTSPLGDVRAMEASSHDLRSTGWYGENGKPVCGIVGSVKAEQLSATGERAPYPELVTADFQRVFRIDISLTTMYCQTVVALTGSFQFTVAAANFHGQARGTCTHFQC